MQYILTEEEYKELTEKKYNVTAVFKVNEDNTIIFTKNKAMELLCCLERAMYQESVNLSKDQVRKLLDISHELMWDIADKFKLDINEGCINVDTLEYKKYAFDEIEDMNN